jgi:Type IV secretory pathway, VirB11 components, and related ATPases involved in archaeal flagella biosynthesis
MPQAPQLLRRILTAHPCTDIHIPAPRSGQPITVVTPTGPVRTRHRPTDACIDRLVALGRRAADRPFGTADPTLDAEITVAGRRCRLAAVGPPLAPAVAITIRVHPAQHRTLTDLIRGRMLPARLAAWLRDRLRAGGAMLIAGPRGAGKTTLCAAAMVALRAETRIITIEDTPELPVDALRRAGRDIQPLRADPTSTTHTPTDAVRAALRLGDSALIIGEVRGPEVAAVYEAIRVGAQSEAVLATIHGGTPRAVRDRITIDLGVSDRSFRHTDAIVCCGRHGGRHLVTQVVTVDAEGFTPVFTHPDAPMDAPAA